MQSGYNRKTCGLVLLFGALIFLAWLCFGCTDKPFKPEHLPQTAFEEQLCAIHWFRAGEGKSGELTITRLFKQNGTFYYKIEQNGGLLYYERGTWQVFGRYNWGWRVVFSIIDALDRLPIGRSYYYFVEIVDCGGWKELHLSSGASAEYTYYSSLKKAREVLPDLMERIIPEWQNHKGKE
ncbi:MAG: hypothetical protein J7L26_04715 [Candidatus Aminicenantes bacterium]|nr:hypothetical protein [Candidatus Aminicenantes bacterium]